MSNPAPCGTTGGYQRHRRAGEPICDPCREANRQACKKRHKEPQVRKAMPAIRQNSTSREVLKLEEAMATEPPVIQWVLHPVKRVMVAAHVYDPYVDSAGVGSRTGKKRQEEDAA